jgi:glycosyltransferase involved in cell wall biosynthesis
MSYLLAALGQAAQVDLYVADAAVDQVVADLVARTVLIPAERRWPSGRLHRRVVDVWTALAAGPPEVWTARPALREVERLLAKHGPYDAVVVQHVGLIPLARRRELARDWVLELHNIGSARAQQQADAQTGGRQAWVSRREAILARRNERRAATLFDSLVAVSSKDAGLLAGHVVVVPNGVDLTRFSVTPLPTDPAVVLTGTLGYLPNVDGIAWFVREVWPRVRAEEPGATLTLVGKSPFPTVRALDGREGIRVVADVPQIEPYLKAARVAIVPLRIGSGTRLKALDAMAAGRPVVGTSIGLEGLEVTHGKHALILDDPADFAAAVVRLIRDDDYAARLVRAGRLFVEAEHDWVVIGRRYADHVLRLAP